MRMKLSMIVNVHPFSTLIFKAPGTLPLVYIPLLLSLWTVTAYVVATLLIQNCYILLALVLFYIVPTPTITTLPSGPIQGAMVGSPQDIQCIVSTVSGVELSSVMISWMGPGGESITNDSRVMISPTTSSGNNYTSNLQFTYLMEGDEGLYTCNVMILENKASYFTDLHNLTGKQKYTF